MNKTIVGITCILASIILFVCSINAQEVSLTGTWTGICYNKSLGKQAKLTVKLEQNGEKIKGYLKASYPLLCRGPLKAWLDERERLNAKIRCIVHGGHAIHLKEGIVDIRTDSMTNQTIGEIKGNYQLSILLSKQEGEFTITKGMQSIENQEGYTSTTFYCVFVNSNSNVFHIADCPKIGTDIMKFSSPEQAREAGGVPCKDCNP